MTKTMKEQAKKCWKKQRMTFALILTHSLEKAYNGKKSLDGFYTQYWTGKSKTPKYQRAYIQDSMNDTNAFVEYILSEDLFKKIKGTDGISYITIYNYMVLGLAQLLYEAVTNEEDFSTNPDKGFDLLKQLSRKKVETFFREIIEAFIIRNCQ